MKIGKKVKIINGQYAGKDVIIKKVFTSMLQGKRILIELPDGKEVWINEGDIEDGK